MNWYLIALVILGALVLVATLYMAWQLRRSGMTQVLLEHRMGEIQEQLEQAEQIFEQAIPRTITAMVPREIARGVQPLTNEVRQLTTRIHDDMVPLAETLNKAQGQIFDATQRFSASSLDIRQVADRFVGMVDDLKKTQNDLQRAVQLLAEPEKLQDWLSLLQETVRPLQIVNESLSQHHDTSTQLLQTTGSLLDRWSLQGEIIADTAGRMEGLLEQWNADETLSRRRSEDKVNQGVYELTLKNAEIANNFLELQSEIKKQTSSVDRFQRNLEQAGVLLNHIAVAQQQAHSDEQQMIEELRRLNQGFVTHEQTLGAQLVQLADQVRNLTQAAQKEQMALQKEAQTMLTGSAANTKRLMKILEDRVDQTMNALELYEQKMSKRQDELIQDASQAIDNLPTRQMQWVQIIVMFVCATAIAILLWLR